MRSVDGRGKPGFVKAVGIYWGLLLGLLLLAYLYAFVTRTNISVGDVSTLRFTGTRSQGGHWASFNTALLPATLLMAVLAASVDRLVRRLR